MTDINKERHNNTDSGSNPVNTFHQFTNAQKIINYNRGKLHSDALANVILKLKKYDKHTAPEYFIVEIVKELKNVLEYLETQNEKLDKQIEPEP